MSWLWTWGGRSFGYRTGDDLFTHGGKHVGHFHGDEVFGQDGHYLGELRGSRLITRRSRNATKGSFTPSVGTSHVNRANYVGKVMLVGYQDFPSPESFA